MERPCSTNNQLINWVGFLCSLLCVVWLRKYHNVYGVNIHTIGIVLILLSIIIPIVLLEFLCLKTYRLNCDTFKFKMICRGDIKRTCLKLLAFYVCIGFMLFVYWLFPVYQSVWYDNYFVLFKKVFVFWMLLAIPYFYYVDSHMHLPKDGYWVLGMVLVGRCRQHNKWHPIVQLFLGWLVKIFFLPLMVKFLDGSLNYVIGFQAQNIFSNFQLFYMFTYEFLYYIDVLFAAVGYICTIKLFDSHIRSTDSTFLGWGVAIMCYPPFWDVFGREYMLFNDTRPWGEWFWDSWVYPIWGGIILILVSVYSWATVSFGLRFSNLTNRGIISTGAYRYFKHPAYLAKNLTWWMIAMPFMVGSTVSEAIRSTLLLCLLNFIYFMRARTEERHLSSDIDYQIYSDYMKKHSLFALINCLFKRLFIKSR